MSSTPTLSDNHLLHTLQHQLQSDLLNFKQCQQLKHSIIQQSKQSILELYDKKVEKVIVERKIQKSAVINGHRMKVNMVKYQLCEQIFCEVLAKLKQMADNHQEDYQILLIKLAMQGCIQLFQHNVTIRALHKDIPMIKSLIPDIKLSFEQFTEEEMCQSFQLQLRVSQVDYLQVRQISQVLSKREQLTHCIGGIVLTDSTGNIVFKNTLDARLNILKQTCLPLMRQMLWGNHASE